MDRHFVARLFGCLALGVTGVCCITGWKVAAPEYEVLKLNRGIADTPHNTHAIAGCLGEERAKVRAAEEAERRRKFAEDWGFRGVNPDGSATFVPVPGVQWLVPSNPDDADWPRFGANGGTFSMHFRGYRLFVNPWAPEVEVERHGWRLWWTPEKVQLEHKTATRIEVFHLFGRKL